MDKFFSSLPTWLTPGLAATLLLGVVFPLVVFAMMSRTPPNQGTNHYQESVVGDEFDTDNSYDNKEKYPSPEELDCSQKQLKSAPENR